MFVEVIESLDEELEKLQRETYEELKKLVTNLNELFEKGADIQEIFDIAYKMRGLISEYNAILDRMAEKLKDKAKQLAKELDTDDYIYVVNLVGFVPREGIAMRVPGGWLIDYYEYTYPFAIYGKKRGKGAPYGRPFKKLLYGNSEKAKRRREAVIKILKQLPRGLIKIKKDIIANAIASVEPKLIV